MSRYDNPRQRRSGLPGLEDVAAARRVQREREEMLRRAHAAGAVVTRRTVISDESFADRVQELRDAHQDRTDEDADIQREATDAKTRQREQLRQLTHIARRVAQAANDQETRMVPDEENPRRLKEVDGAARKKVPFYRRELKSKFARKVINNRGDYQHAEAGAGWILTKGGESIKGAPGKADLTNKSGLGLVLTEDGRLFTYIAQTAPKSQPSDRKVRAKVHWPVREKKDRTDIDRMTFLPKAHRRETVPGDYGERPEPEPLQPYKTFFKRPTGPEDRPTLLKAIDDPENLYATEVVIEQAFDALARFVQMEDLEPPQAPAQP